MFGVDEQLASLSTGASFAVVALVAALLGLRHATDPDHLTAVTTLVAGDPRGARGAGRLGFAWGLGHATSLFAVGLPIVLFHSFLPGAVQNVAEAAVGVMIVALSLRLLARWHSGALRRADGARRTARQAYGIGLVHGVGGSAGIGILLLASIAGTLREAVAMALFAVCTAVSMSLASTGLGMVLSQRVVERRYLRVAPVLGALSLSFGVWYALGAVQAVPYVF
jgi:high-affinity nickel permease